MASELFKLVGTIAIDATDATQNINAVITAGADLESKLIAIGTGADSSIGEKSGFSKASVWLGNVLTQLSNKVWDLGTDFVSLGFKFNASAETYKASIKAMLGLTDEETDALYEKLYDFAKETPYAMSGVMESAIKLFNVGMNQDDTLRTLAVLGDLAGGNSEKMTRLIKAYTDTMGYGFLRAQERNQFVENEVLLYGLLADYYEATSRGVFTADQIAQMQADKAISDEDVWAALEHATSEEGRYYNYMAVLMETWAGKTEKLGDDVAEAAGAFTEPFFDVLKDETIDKLSEVINKITDWANNNPEVLSNLAIALSDLSTNGLDVLLGGLTGIIEFWNEHQDAFKMMTAILGGLLMVTGHPVAGLGMLVLSEVVDESALDELSKTEDGRYRTNILIPGVTQQMNDSLPDNRDAGRYHYFSEKARAIAESMWDMERLGLTGEDVSGWETFMSQVYDEFGKIATELGVADTQAGVSALLMDLVNQMMLLDKSKENLPDDWFYDPNKQETTDYTLRPQTVDPSLLVGNAGGANVAFIASMQSVISQMKSEVSAGAQEGVSNGLSGVTITGTITTGDVKLDTGTVVGEFAPLFDLKLGTANARAGRG